MSADKIDPLRRLEQALLDKDIATAAALLADIKATGGASEVVIRTFTERLDTLKEDVEAVDTLFSAARRAITAGDPAAAVEKFSQILKLQPDNEKAWEGLQKAKRMQEHKTAAEKLFADALAARNDHHLETALEKCKDALELDPQNDTFSRLRNELLSELEKKHHRQRLMILGEQLFSEGKYEEALNTFERIEDPELSEESQAWIQRTREAMRTMDMEARAKLLLREAHGALANEQYEKVFEILKDFPRESALALNADICRKKAETGQDNEKLVNDIQQELLKSIESSDWKKARRFREMLMQIAPDAPLIEKTEGAIPPVNEG